MAVEPRLQPRRGTDDKDRVLDQMVLAWFVADRLGQRPCSRGIEPHVEEAVRCGIDSSVQPVSLPAELDPGFVDSDVIRVGVVD